MTESSAHRHDHDKPYCDGRADHRVLHDAEPRGEPDDAKTPARETVEEWHDPEVGFEGVGEELVASGAGRQLLTIGELVNPGLQRPAQAALVPVRQYLAAQPALTAASVGLDSAVRESMGLHRAAQGVLGGVAAWRNPVFDQMSAITDMIRPPLLDLNLGRYLFGAVDFTSQWVDELYPSGSILPSVLRPVDMIRPLLPDLSAVFTNFVDTTAVFEGLWRDPGLWRVLDGVGSQVTLGVIRRAWNDALHHGPDALAEFVRDWLDRKPTRPRREATWDVLLELDWDELPGDGRDALSYLRARVRDRYRCTRLLLDQKLRGGLIIASDDDPARELLVTAPGPTVEDRVLDELEPITDPRLQAVLHALDPHDQKIVLLKGATGCPWATAAEQYGRDRSYGEVLRRRLDRRRIKLGGTP